jgi:hypothetical protein
MQVRRIRWNIGVWSAAVAIAGGLAVCGVPPASAEETTTTGNRVFFRGGFAALNSGRGGELFVDGHNALGRGTNDGSTGYYVGAGEDIMLTKDLWGMMKEIAVLGEIGVEYKRFSSKTVANSDTPTVTGVSNGNLLNKVQVTMLTVDIAPKVKFRQGSDFQPWIIPVGLDFHVISPPSNQTTVLDIGVQFGAGAEYRIWKELWLGVDARYHLASNQTNTVNNYGTVGAYVGIGF